MQTDIGDVEIKMSKVMDCSGNGISFNKLLLLPYLKRVKVVKSSTVACLL